MKNLAVMIVAMGFMRRLDQEEPMVLMYARMVYLGYIVITAAIYILLHLRIVARRDTNLITVPIAAKPPSFSEAMAAAQEKAEDAERKKTDETEDDDDETEHTEDSSKEEDSPKEEIITVMEYDLRQLNTTRRAWITNACLLALIHYKMESVSPLVMQSLMGLTRLLSDDPLFQIHIRGAPSVGALKRPFTPEKNPLANMLKDFAPKPEESKEADGSTTSTAPTAVPQAPEEDLHDDGDSEDDDSPPPAIADLKDDHIKSDFDEDDEKEETEAKKSK